MKDIKTPSGYTVSMKQFLTYGQFLEIQRAILSKSKLDLATNTLSDTPPDVLFEAAQMAMKFVLDKVTLPDATIHTNPIQAVQDMPVADGSMIADEANRILGEASPQKKNQTK